MRTLYAGRLFDVVEEDRYEIVSHPGSVAILPVDRDGRVVLVRQHRAPARRTLVELPAGTLEPAEEPEATAKRELREETGLRGGSWRLVARFWTTPGFVREEMHLFLATDLEEGEPDAEDDEDIELLRWTRGEVEANLSGIEDAKTLAGLLHYLRECP